MIPSDVRESWSIVDEVENPRSIHRRNSLVILDARDRASIELKNKKKIATINKKDKQYYTQKERRQWKENPDRRFSLCLDEPISRRRPSAAYLNEIPCASRSRKTRSAFDKIQPPSICKRNCRRQTGYTRARAI